MIYLTATGSDRNDRNRNLGADGQVDNDNDDDKLFDFSFLKGKPNQCLSLNFEQEMDELLSQDSAKQVFLIMPAKAAGTSLNAFTHECMKVKYGKDFHNFSGEAGVNFPWMDKDFLMHSFEMPSIISSHLMNSVPFLDIAKHATRKTLMIYVHREETERTLSAIREVLTQQSCAKDVNAEDSIIVNRNETHCVLDEKPVLDIIRERRAEIGASTFNALNCESYKAIKENAANLVVVHYKQASKLQEVLAKHHCPALLEKPPTEANVATEKHMEVYLRLEKKRGGVETVVKLDEWMDEKREVLEWSLQIKKHVTCQGKTKNMEDELFACEDQALKVSPSAVRYW